MVVSLIHQDYFVAVRETTIHSSSNIIQCCVLVCGREWKNNGVDEDRLLPV